MKRNIFLIVLVLLLVTLTPFAVSYYRRMLYRPHLTVVGFACMSDGIGRQSVEIIDAMKDFVSVGFYPTQKSLMTDVPEGVQKIMHKKKMQLGKVVLYEDIFYSFSHVFFQKRFKHAPADQIRIAYSMFESSQIPQQWVHNLNLYFDAVVVPDSYHIDVYQNSGVTIPIFVIPLGLNLQPFLQAPLKKSFHTPFVFANFSTCILRKNHRELIKAFHAAFGDSPEVALWINSRYTEDHLFEALQEEIASLGVHNILLTNQCPDKAQYLENFQKIDCYVSISQSEGFSIQPREAMALGIPCIVSDNTAQSTICKSNLVTSIPCPHKEPAYYELFQEVFGYRYNIDFTSCVDAMCLVYHNKEKYLSQGAAMRSWASYYDYAQLQGMYKTLIKPTKIALGDRNSIDGDTLTTNSAKLYKKYKAL